MATSLVSEREIRAAVRDGRKSLDVAGAVVTPAARDLAGALGVTLVGDARSGRGKSPERRGAPPKREAGSARPAGSHQISAAPTTSPPASGSAPKPTIAVGADHGGVAM